MQVASTVDIPSSIMEPLPPIFGSKVCMTYLLLSVSTWPFPRGWVTTSEDDDLLDIAEEAVNTKYEKEIAAFYHEAKTQASAAWYDKTLQKGSTAASELDWATFLIYIKLMVFATFIEKYMS